jgi:hypothetical protein
VTEWQRVSRLRSTPEAPRSYAFHATDHMNRVRKNPRHGQAPAPYPITNPIDRVREVRRALSNSAACSPATETLSKLGGMMQKLALLFGALTIFSVAGCGAKVVVDSPGSGGAGGEGQGGGVTATATAVSSSSSGQPSPCDDTGSCEKCVNCTVGIVCAEQWEKCATQPPCIDLVYCLASCQNQDPCIEKCLAVFPEAIDVYNETANCVMCNACVNDCNGLAKGCP